MAQRRQATEKPDLTPDAVAPPPGEPPDTIPIYGILGESDIPDSVRLYLDTGLSTYYEIPVDAIAEREKVPANLSPLGVDSTLLLVRKGTKLVVIKVETRTVEDEFLSGDFTAPGSFTPSPAAVAPVVFPTPTATFSLRCHTFGFTCTSLPPQCPQRDTVHLVSRLPCPSVQQCFTLADWGCPPPPSLATNCPTNVGPQCPPRTGTLRCVDALSVSIRCVFRG